MATEVGIGGYTPPKPASPAVEAITTLMRPLVEQQLGKTFEMFKAVTYISQVVAGLNYKIKVVVAPQTTANTCVHMTVFSALPEGGITLAYTLDHASLKESKLDEPLS